MCGIIGGIDTPKYRERLEGAFKILKHRGEDSFGLIAETQTNSTIKKSLHLHPFLQELDTVPQGDFLLCHNRKTSIGGTTLPLAHPITSENKLVHIVHNGTKKSLFTAIQHSLSDTEAIASVVSRHFEATELLFDILNGCGVVFAKHTETGEVIFHLDGERPLFINEHRTVVSSEPVGTGKWLLIKEQITKFDSFLDFMSSVETFEESVTILKTDVVSSKYCSACTKTHLHSAGAKRCFVCEILDIKPKATYYNNNYSTMNDYYKYELNHIYEMSHDKLTWVKKQLTGKYWNNGSYIYKSGAETFKHIRKVVVKITPVIGNCYSFESTAGRTLQGKLEDIASGLYTLRVTVKERFVSRNLIAKIDVHPILEEGERYNFFDNSYQKPTEAVFTGLTNKESYPYNVLQDNGVTTFFARALPLEPTEKRKPILAEQCLDEWIWCYVLSKEVNDFYLCEDVETGESVEALDIRSLPTIAKDDLIEVSEDNVFWDYAVVTTPPAEKGSPVEAYYSNSSITEQFKYYRGIK
jgi:hypothetical protein